MKETKNKSKACLECGRVYLLAYADMRRCLGCGEYLTTREAYVGKCLKEELEQEEKDIKSEKGNEYA